MTAAATVPETLGAASEMRYRDLEIGTLVFVSGPSTVGKSSFIRRLVSGTLPREIQTRFPEGVRSWESVEPKNFVSFSDSRSAGGAAYRPGLIFHYDTMRVHNRGWGSYSEDRALDIFFSARLILLVDIRASASDLERNWVARIARQRPQRPFRRVAKSIKRLLLRRRYVPEIVIRKEGFSTLDSYREAEWVEAAYALWDEFLKCLTQDAVGAAGGEVQIISVNSIARASSEPEFRLA